MPNRNGFIDWDTWGAYNCTQRLGFSCLCRGNDFYQIVRFLTFTRRYWKLKCNSVGKSAISRKSLFLLLSRAAWIEQYSDWTERGQSKKSTEWGGRATTFHFYSTSLFVGFPVNRIRFETVDFHNGRARCAILSVEFIDKRSSFIRAFHAFVMQRIHCVCFAAHALYSWNSAFWYNKYDLARRRSRLILMCWWCIKLEQRYSVLTSTRLLVFRRYILHLIRNCGASIRRPIFVAPRIQSNCQYLWANPVED